MHCAGVYVANNKPVIMVGVVVVEDRDEFAVVRWWDFITGVGNDASAVARWLYVVTGIDKDDITVAKWLNIVMGVGNK